MKVAFIGLGVMQSMAENWTGAEAAFARALTIEPLSEDAGLGWGDALMHLGRTTEATNAYRRVATINPNNLPGKEEMGE